jgi:hypothetical protein
VTLALARLRNQRLVGPGLESPAAVVRWLGAVQSQDYAGATWALSLRCGGVTAASINSAFDAGRILRTHVMRPTWHFVSAEDIRWLLALTAPRVHAVNAFVYRSVELNEATLRRTSRLITRALQGREARTRLELSAALEKGGVPASGLRLAYIVMHAELNALICSGPMRGKQHTYMLLEERVPPAPALKRDEALAVLAGRYFTSHGPASVHDFAWWSGLTVAEGRAGLDAVKSSLESTAISGKMYWGPTMTPAGSSRNAAPARARGVTPVVHLLSNYDEHVVAYRDHSHSVDPAAREAMRSRGSQPLAVHLIARDGLVVGGWRRTIALTHATVTAQLLVSLSAQEKNVLKAAAEDYGRFLNLPVKVATG